MYSAVLSGSELSPPPQPATTTRAKGTRTMARRTPLLRQPDGFEGVEHLVTKMRPLGFREAGRAEPQDASTDKDTRRESSFDQQDGQTVGQRRFEPRVITGCPPRQRECSENDERPAEPQHGDQEREHQGPLLDVLLRHRLLRQPGGFDGLLPALEEG